MEDGEEAMNVHVMESGQSHREQTQAMLQIMLIYGEINVCGTILRKRGEYVDVPRRTLLSIDTHAPSVYTVQKVHHRENTNDL